MTNPKDIAKPPVDNPAKSAPKNEWTLQKGIAPGAQLALGRHLVGCIEIVRAEATYDVWRVKVLGPITMMADGEPLLPKETVPPLLWLGEVYDTGGAFTPQRAPKGYR